MNKFTFYVTVGDRMIPITTKERDQIVKMLMEPHYMHVILSRTSEVISLDPPPNVLRTERLQDRFKL